MGEIEARLCELGIELPPTPTPVGSYLPAVAVRGFVFVSGQLPIVAGEVRYRGAVGRDLGLDDGIAAARLCAVNLIAQLKAAVDGDLERVMRVVRLGGFVQAEAGFADHPRVLNGASELMVAVFGERGRHARAAVGCSSLPLDAAVEVDGIFAVA